MEGSGPFRSSLPRASSCLPGPAACSGNGHELDTCPALERVSVLGGEGRRSSYLQDHRSDRSGDRHGQGPGGGGDWGLTAGGLREMSQ